MRCRRGPGVSSGIAVGAPARAVGLRLSHKISLVLLALILFGATLVGVLAYYKYRSLLSSLIVTRVEVTLANLQNDIQSPLRLGLSLRDVRTIKPLLETTVRQDSLITSISVFGMGADNQVLYSTAGGLVGNPPEAGWVKAAGGKGEGKKHFWHYDAGNVRTIGSVLVDRLDQPVGAVALTYDATYEDSKLAAMRAGMMRDVAVISVVLTVISALIMYLFFRPVSGHLDRLSRELEAREGNAAGAQASDGRESSAETSDGIDREYARFRQTADAAERQLAALEKTHGNGAGNHPGKGDAA